MEPHIAAQLVDVVDLGLALRLALMLELGAPDT
jgi:hypothetical protein